MKKDSKKSKIIVVCGPTATGKSALAVELARMIGGEVISADSRQVYTGLTIGTGKITKREMKGVTHHLLDVTSPKRRFSVEDFKQLGQRAVVDILSRGRVPIVCGGSGFYIQALVDNISLPEVPPNTKLRTRLERKNAAELFAMLKKLDPRRAKEIDAQNPRRLVRAIEIAAALGMVPPVKPARLYEPLFIGIDLPDNGLRARITKRLLARMKQGMLREAVRLHKGGLSWKRMNELGLEYRFLALLLQKKISRVEFTEKLTAEIWQYAKRQRTWFRRDKRVGWFDPSDKKAATHIVKQVKTFTKPLKTTRIT